LTGQPANIGIAIPDDELVDRVLTNLPASWNTLRQMISGRERPPTYDELKDLLILEDGIHSMHRECDDKEEAMFTHQESAMFASWWNPRDRSTNCGFFNPRGRGFPESSSMQPTFRGCSSRAHNFGSGVNNFTPPRGQAARCSNFLPSQHRNFSPQDVSSGACHLCGNPYH
jgi:hypothetical protein